MAFITVNGSVTSYAEADDVRDKDQRVFEANEINFSDAPENPATLDEYVEDLAAKATQRISQKIRASSQWRGYLGYTDSGYNTINNIPEFNPDLILGRQSDFTDLCAYYTLKEYVYPKIADFGNPESSEVQKIQYFESKFTDLFEELLAMMDWYDLDDSGAVDLDERKVTFSRTRRTRGRRSVVRTR
jgi:hypothetical protein